MNAITIEAALQMILDLVNAVRSANSAGATTIPAGVWTDAISGRKQDQAKLDADIAGAKAAGF